MTKECPIQPGNNPLSEDELLLHIGGFKRQLIGIFMYRIPRRPTFDTDRRIIREVFNPSGTEAFSNISGQYLVLFYRDIDRLTIKKFTENATLQQESRFSKNKSSGNEDPERQLSQEVLMENGTIRYRDFSPENPIDEANNNLALELTTEFLRRYEWESLKPFSGNLEDFKSVFGSQPFPSP